MESGDWRHNIIYNSFGSNLRMKKKHETSSLPAAPAVQRHIINI